MAKQKTAKKASPVVNHGLYARRLWALRKEIVLGSLFVSDYENSRNIDPHTLCDFMDGYVDYLWDMAREDLEDGLIEKMPRDNFEVFASYDTKNNLYDYFYDMNGCGLFTDIAEDIAYRC